jgi:hypothetical protein
MLTYPYRFKTEAEFIEEYGENWRDIVNNLDDVNTWNDEMDYLFGKEFPYIDKKIIYDRPYPMFGYFRDDNNKVWGVSWYMLTPNIPKIPTYKPKNFKKTFESNFYESPLKIQCNNNNDAERCEKFLIDNGYYWNNGVEKIPLLPRLLFKEITIYVHKDTKIIRGIFGEGDNENTLFYPSDVSKIMSILRIPLTYKSKEFKKTLENMNIEKTFESFLSNELLEKSSLNKLGVPREVMQPLQKDFAIPADAEWESITLKSEVEDILRKGTKEFILQIAKDSIIAFVSYPSARETKYFIDSYILVEDGWNGEYIKQDREDVSLTQLLYHIESRMTLYHLKSNFSLIRQGKRKLIQKEKSFDKFTTEFKKDFLSKFDSILKRIVGSKYKDAKQEIRDKARQIEMENKMMLSGLDDPLSGPNSLTILDDFLMQFEDAYSEFFGERLDIQELSNYFTYEKILTSFMYFIYVGKLLN